MTAKDNLPAGQPSADSVAAGQYFDLMLAPDLVTSGTPPDGVAFLRRQYCEGAPANPQAMADIHRALLTDSAAEQEDPAQM